jgi:hypothetical protein
MKKSVFAAAALAVLFAGAAHANDPKVAIAALDDRLAKIGAAKLDNNYDVVDEIKKTTGASATIFVKEGDEFVRVSTNVLTTEGKRGVGTQLARAKAYEAVSKGEKFCGVVDVIGTQLDSCYHPIKDGAGKVIGLTYVGYKK